MKRRNYAVEDAMNELNKYKPARQTPEKLVEALRTCGTIGACLAGECPFYGRDCGSRMKLEAADLIEELMKT